MDNEFNGGKRGGKTENIYRELENWISTFTPAQKRKIERELEQEKDDEEEKPKGFADSWYSLKYGTWDSTWTISSTGNFNTTDNGNYIVYAPTPLASKPVIEDNVQDVDFSEE